MSEFLIVDTHEIEELRAKFGLAKGNGERVEEMSVKKLGRKPCPLTKVMLWMNKRYPGVIDVWQAVVKSNAENIILFFKWLHLCVDKYNATCAKWRKPLSVRGRGRPKKRRPNGKIISVEKVPMWQNGTFWASRECLDPATTTTSEDRG